MRSANCDALARLCAMLLLGYMRCGSSGELFAIRTFCALQHLTEVSVQRTRKRRLPTILIEKYSCLRSFTLTTTGFEHGIITEVHEYQSTHELS